MRHERLDDGDRVAVNAERDAWIPTHDEIAARAQARSKARVREGCAGSADEDWRVAEAELRHEHEAGRGGPRRETDQ